MSLAELAGSVRRGWRLTLLVAFVVVAGITTWSLLTPNTYTATATLFVSFQGTAEGVVQSERLDSYAALGTSDQVLRRVAEEVGGGESVSSLRDDVSVVSPTDSVLLEVAAVDGSAEDAALIANSVGRELASLVTDLERRQSTGNSPVRASVAEPATPPSSPSAPKVARNVAFAVVVGLGLGALISLVRDVFDTRIRDSRELSDEYDLPLLGVIDHSPTLANGQLLVHTPVTDRESMSQEELADLSKHSRILEEFRKLRTGLEFIERRDSKRSVIITSSVPSEGKTTIAGNLAIAISLADVDVALLDCDLRRPALSKLFGLQDDPGLVDVLIERKELTDVGTTKGRLRFIPTGTIPPNPSELIDSDRMSDLLAELDRHHEIVILDTPPLGPFTDAAALAPRCGAVVMITRSMFTRRQHLEHSLDTLARVDAAPGGVVLNSLPRSASRGYYQPNGYPYGYQ